MTCPIDSMLVELDKARWQASSPAMEQSGKPMVMAEHRIFVEPSRPLEVVNTDLVVEVQADGQKLGELRMSRGSIDWIPRAHQIGTSLTWEQFDQLMAEYGES